MPINLTSTQWLRVIAALLAAGDRDLAGKINNQRADIEQQRGQRRFVLVLPRAFA